MNIAIVGQGYVGLAAAVCIAEAGHRVIGVESNSSRLEVLKRGRMPFFEPGICELLADLHTRGSLTFTGSIEECVAPVDAVLIAVGTPQLPSGGTDLRQVAAAMRSVSVMRPPPPLVMMKSTVPPGTSERLLAESDGQMNLGGRYVYSPEFLSQGAALSGWRRPSRIVIGLRNSDLLPIVYDVYRDIDAPTIVTTPTNAEMIKYASNAFLATKISFINEIANLCDDVGASVDTVVDGIGLDVRIGTAFLRAGVGYGGSCFPKDTRALAHLSSMKGRSMPLLEAVITVNKAQRLRVVRMLHEHLDGYANPQVAVLGLSFKPGTDDLREAPSVTVIPELIARGLQIRVWDPVVSQEQIARVFPGVERAATVEAATAGAHAALVLTEWPDVVEANWRAVATAMVQPRLVVDGRNCLDTAVMRSNGFVYRGIGRSE